MFVLFKWFENNLMKGNSDKSHLVLSTSTSSTANINGDTIKSYESEKLLGVMIDYKNLSKVCDKASQKLHVLTRISLHMNINQRKRIIRAFISSQFGFNPLALYLKAAEYKSNDMVLNL